MSKMEVEQQKNGADVTLKLKGHFDEHATIPDLDLNGVTSVTVDAEKVESINSVGVRSWIKWINDNSPKVNIVYSKCPKIIVDQMNMVASLLKPNIRIDSFFVPYFCESCNTSFPQLFERGKEYNEERIDAPKAMKCPKCGGNADIDVIEKTYFRFLKLKG